MTILLFAPQRFQETPHVHAEKCETMGNHINTNSVADSYGYITNGSI
jgi:hypothetical protein